MAVLLQFRSLELQSVNFDDLCSKINELDLSSDYSYIVISIGQLF